MNVPSVSENLQACIVLFMTGFSGRFCTTCVDQSTIVSNFIFFLVKSVILFFTEDGFYILNSGLCDIHVFGEIYTGFMGCLGWGLRVEMRISSLRRHVSQNTRI